MYEETEGTMADEAKSLSRMSPKLDLAGLQILLKKESAQIVSELELESSGCKELLNEVDTISTEVLELLVGVLAKACKDTDSKNLNNLLPVVWQSRFLSTHLSLYITSLLGDDENPVRSDVLSNLTVIMEALILQIPSSSSEVMVIVLLLESVVKSTQFQKRCTGLERVAELISNIQQLKDTGQLRETEFTVQNERAMVRSQYKPPPNDFRLIPILPEIGELHKNQPPFLRQNLVKGQYRDVDHYLDVQFRLLREDFIAPLREGIAEYLETLQNQAAEPCRRRLQDLRLYQNVRILRPTVGKEGINHIIEFDTSRLRRVRWESSKRLLYGSLLCLTKDNFSSVIFAVVEGRKIDDIEEGILEIRFRNLDDIAGVEDSDLFLMAETTAYFEAYRPVLEGIQQLDEITMPMQQYIINVAKEIEPPAYIEADSDTVYDLQCLTQECHDDDELNTTSLVPVLDVGAWPDAEKLQFDESQLRAFHSALSTELALIQGPPGTGKTYVGLKIVQTMLHNRSVMNSENYFGERKLDFRPILIVCYTNHALDQFLEGILEFEKNITRVGGRSQSQSLKDYNLHVKLQKQRQNNEVPNFIVRRRFELKEYHYVKSEMEDAKTKIELSHVGILRMEELRLTLRQYHEMCWVLDDIVNSIPRERCRDSHAIMMQWLGLIGKSQQRRPQFNDGKGSKTDYAEDSNLVVLEEAQLIQMQRELLVEDDDRVSDRRRQRVLRDFEYLLDTTPSSEDEDAKFRRREVDRIVRKELFSSDLMTLAEVEVVNVWAISKRNRWRLYRLFLEYYIKAKEEVLSRRVALYQRLAAARQELDEEEESLILCKTNVIGMTTTGAARNRSLLQRVKPPIIIVEEAAEILESHVITTLSSDCQHLILIGDHQQLRPNAHVYRLAKQFKLDVSLFERMINNGVPCHRLALQHRMRPEISKIMKKFFYPDLQDHDSVVYYPNMIGMQKNVFFLEHNHPEAEVDDTQSRSNFHEAEFLVGFCRYLLQQSYKPSQITILTTYTGQLFNFKRLMDKQTFNGIRVCVVDNFQGEENDIILLSLVRSNDEGSVGFLKVSNRICVALSRARVGLFCVGNLKLLSEKSELWRGILRTLEDDKFTGRAMPLVCQNHPDTITYVACADDFNQIPDGGCTRDCEWRLECGHACGRKCHSFDPDHTQYICKKPCMKECTRGHKCHLPCGEPCRCTTKLTKTFPVCGHKVVVDCYNIDRARCMEPCRKKLKCGHQCPLTCGEYCIGASHCRKPCEKRLPCGHDCWKLCKDICPTQYDCLQPITILLDKCGHTKYMLCNQRQRKFSLQPLSCDESCPKILLCGHQCKNKCGEICSTCLEPCKRKQLCGHPCQRKCCEPCRCTVNVNITRPDCGHIKVVECYQKDEIVSTPCDEPCERQLVCGHRCKKVCGETCIRRCMTLVENLKAPQHCCHHQRQIRCYKVGTTLELTESRFPIICQEMCAKTLPCGHRCQSLCRLPCIDRCDRIIFKTFACGHSWYKTCFSGYTCTKPCEKRLECGHLCRNKCGEPCSSAEECRESVQKIIPYCGHVNNLLCTEDPQKAYCRYPVPCRTCGKGHCGKCKPNEHTITRRRQMFHVR